MNNPAVEPSAATPLTPALSPRKRREKEKSKKGKSQHRGGSRTIPVNLYHKTYAELVAYAERHYPKIPLRMFKDGLKEETPKGEQDLLRKLLLEAMKDQAQVESMAARQAKDGVDALQKNIQNASGPVPSSDVVQAAKDINAKAAEGVPPVSRPELQEKPVVKDWIVGQLDQRQGMVTPNGVRLMKDNDPVLPEHLAFADIPGLSPVVNDPNDPTLAGDISKQLEELLPQGLRGNKGPMKKPFRHPQHTAAFLNRETGAAFHPTETLMRNDKMVPLFEKDPQTGKPVLPAGVIWGD